MNSSKPYWPQLSDLNGTTACVSLSTSLISALLSFSFVISIFYRYRHTFFLCFYKSHETSTRASNQSAKVPYEAIVLLIFSFPRLVWLARFGFENLVDGSFAVLPNTDIWGYVFFVYMVRIDMFSRRSFKRDTWTKYWERKERLRAENTIGLFPTEKEEAEATELRGEPESIDAKHELSSITTSEPTKPRTFSNRLRSLFTTPTHSTLPEPSAAVVLTRIHFAAFIQAFLLCNTVYPVSSAVCGAGATGLTEDQSLVVGIMALVPYFCFRCVALLLQGRRFARTEMEWENAL